MHFWKVAIAACGVILFSVLDTSFSVDDLILTLKIPWGVNPYGFSKNALFRRRVKAYFFVTFNIILSHIFPENFFKSFRKYEDSPVTKKLMT